MGIGELAAGMAGMRRDAPPDWMERLLLLVLQPDSREPVSGDLLEEYRQDRLPRLGLAGADRWYLRQLIGFVLIRVGGGFVMKSTLISVCFFNVAAGLWLGVMEQVLRHSGYAGRSVLAAGIALQALLTLAVLLWSRSSPLRYVVEMGAVAIAALAVAALYRIFATAHFEGFVLIIGAALLIQSVLTFVTLLPRRLELTT